MINRRAKERAASVVFTDVTFISTFQDTKKAQIRKSKIRNRTKARAKVKALGISTVHTF